MGVTTSCIGLSVFCLSIYFNTDIIFGLSRFKISLCANSFTWLSNHARALSMNMHILVCTCKQIEVDVDTPKYKHTHTHTHTCINTHTHKHAYIYTCTHTHTRVHTQTHTHTHTHTHTQTHTHTHTHTHKHTLTHCYLAVWWLAFPFPAGCTKGQTCFSSWLPDLLVHHPQNGPSLPCPVSSMQKKVSA